MLVTQYSAATEQSDEDLGDEEGLMEEADFPDLVGVSDTSEIMDEFALLEEASGFDEVQSASKHRQSIFWSPSAVTIFTKEDVRGSPLQTLPDILRRVPGFDIYDVKPTFPLVGARALTGLSNNLVLLLVDGRETLIEMTGFPLWTGLTINDEEIERIEVIRGPGSALYGANAFAAVVSITTVNEKPDNVADAFVHFGERGLRRLNLQVRDSYQVLGGDLSFSIGGITRGQYFPSNRQTGSNGLSFHSWVNYRRPSLLLSMQAGLSFISGTMVQVAGDARTEDVVVHWEMAKAEFILSQNAKLKAQVYHNRFDTDFTFASGFYAYDIWIFDVPHLLATVDSIDSQLQFDWRVLDDLLVIIGAGHRYSGFAEQQGFVLESDSETRGAVFGQLEWRYQDMLQLTGGLRFDFNNITQPALSPRVVAVLRPWSQHSFRLGYGLAFRKPSWMEHGMHFDVQDYNQAVPGIVDKMAVSFGNPDLRNEEVHSFEAGWRAHLLDKRLRLSADLFFNLYRDSIDFFVDVPITSLGLPDLLNSTLTFQNTGTEADALGGEIEVSWHPGTGWSFWGNLGLRYVTGIESGKRLRTEPVARINLGVRYLPTLGLRADVSLHYVSRYEAPEISPAGLLGEPGFAEIGNCVLMMARLGYAVNLGDQRTIEAGINLRSPLTGSFREFPGGPYPPDVVSRIPGDSMGERIVRLVTFFVRAAL